MPDDKKQPPRKEEEIVRSLVPDPAQPPDVRVLVGFLGRSARERSWRLYVTPNFSDYVEFGKRMWSIPERLRPVPARRLVEPSCG